MMKEKQTETNAYEIDLLHLVKVLWSKAWIIAVSCILLGVMGFGYARLRVTPVYESSALLYVNNSSISLGGTSVSISSGQLSAAKSLIDTYSVIMHSRMTLNAVIRKANVGYTYEQLNAMVRAQSVNDTEIFSITVTSEDPAEAVKLANAIADVLPDKIGDVVNGSSVKIVDRAEVSYRVTPGARRYALIGFLLGFLISALVIVAADMLDSVVRNEEYLMQTYELPVLGLVPDLRAPESGSDYGTNSSRKKEI